MSDSQGGGAGQTGHETADPYPSEGGTILTPQNGVRPWPHTRSMGLLHEGDGLFGIAYRAAYTDMAIVRAGRRWEVLWETQAPVNPAAFTTDPAGRLVLVTGGPR